MHDAIKGTSLCTLLLLWGISTGPLADTLVAEKEGPNNPPVQTFDLYRTPTAITPSTTDLASDCYTLEREMSALVPQTYSYKPDVYNDAYQGAAIWIGTTLFIPAYALSGYSAYLQYQEDGRMISAEQRIELLRHLKAENHCFET